MNASLGKTLKNLRHMAGLTQGQLAEALDVSYQQIQKYEAGSNRLPIDKLYQLKKLYNVPYDTFFTGFEGGGIYQDLDTPARTGRALIKLHGLKDHRLKGKIVDILMILMD